MVAVAKELLDAVIRLPGVDVRPVRHVELLVHRKPPLLVLAAHAALVSLGTQVVSVEGVAVRLLVDVLQLLDVVLVNFSSDDVLAKPRTGCRQRALARSLNKRLVASGVGCVSFIYLKVNRAAFAYICGVALVRRI